MKKAVWLAFGAAIVGVNAAAEAVEYFTDTELVAYFRVMLIMGVLFIAMIFLGAYALVSAAEEEKPSPARFTIRLAPIERHRLRRKSPRNTRIRTPDKTP